MNSLIKDVLAFHSKNGLPIGVTIPQAKTIKTITTTWNFEKLQCTLQLALCEFREHAFYAESTTKDHRPFRILLLLLEFIELIEAVQKGQKETAQELADMVYLLFGTAVSCRISLNRVVREVSRSNMTKEGVCPSCNGKGESYIPPDIEKALYENI